MEMLSNATGGTVVIDDIRYHVNDKNKLMRKWTDLYIHVANENDEMLPINQVLESVDYNLKTLSSEYDLHIHRVVPAFIGIVEEEFDTALTVLVALLVVIFVGLITMIVCCLCLKRWYTIKIHETLVLSDEVDPGNTTENPLWTEQKLKLYEEQELSMSVAPDHDNIITTEADVAAMNFRDDAESAVYATLRKSTAGSINSTNARQMQNGRNDYATLNDRTANSGLHSTHSTFKRNPEPSVEGHEYHELNTHKPTDEKPSCSNGKSNLCANNKEEGETRQSTLTIDKDGEPILVAELL